MTGRPSREAAASTGNSRILVNCRIRETLNPKRYQQEGTAERQALVVDVLGQVVQVRQAKEKWYNCYSAAYACALRS